MKFFLRRALLHCTLFIVLISSVLLIASRFPEEVYWTIFGVATVIISAFALINIFGELAFAVCTKTQDKSSLFKIIVIRTIKFLCYLIMTLPVSYVCKQNESVLPLFFAILMIVLFFIYVIVEFSFFKRRTKNSEIQ